MKTLVKLFVVLVIVFAGMLLKPQQASAQNNPVSLQVFYDELSPYGTWIQDQTYGYVWVPRVDEDFSPYVTNGHWVYTDYGWTWVSDYPWGWAAFHYGRWFVDPMYGNVWIPDTEWGPAWVSWRQANGYIGWTPMGPGIDINIALRNSYNVPRDRWNFVRDRDFIQFDLNRYCMDRNTNYNIFNISLIIRNTRYDNDRHSTYFFGPRRDDIQRVSGRMITSVHIRDYDRPGQSYDRDYLNIYRPQVKRANAYGQMPAPRNVSRGNSREEINSTRDNSNKSSNQYYQDRNTRQVQQSNAPQYRNQREEQMNRNSNQGKSTQQVQQPNVNNQQQVQQPNVNPSGNQRESQSSRNDNYYLGRSSQQVQQPNVNATRTQSEQQPSRTYYPDRNAKPVQQPVANQSNQRETQTVRNDKPVANKQQPSGKVVQEKSKMVKNPARDKNVESNRNTDDNHPRR